MNRRDFALLHRTQAQHAGIVLCKYETDFTAQAAKIDAAIQDVELQGQLIRIGRDNL